MIIISIQSTFFNTLFYLALTLKKEKYDEVYVLGHSLGDADFEVLKCINKDAKFYCFYYGDKPNEVMESTLKRLGVNAETISNGDLYEVI